MPITRLTGESDNAAVWSRLPPLAWANKFAGAKADRRACACCWKRRRERRSWSAANMAAGGRWRLPANRRFAGRWPGFGKEHNRFWRQIILWLVQRDDLNRDDVWIKLDQRRLNPGSKLTIRAGRRTRGGRSARRCPAGNR